MIVKKSWVKRASAFTEYWYEGYFLFGFIPLFIKREER